MFFQISIAIWMLHTNSHCAPLNFSAGYPMSQFVLFYEDIHNVISTIFFQPPRFVYLQKILQKPKMIHFQFFTNSMTIAGETVRKNGLKFCKKKVSLHIDLSRCISLFFLSVSVALSRLSFYQLFHDFENFMSLFGDFQFLSPTCYLKVIHLRYNPDTIIIN